MAITKIPVPPWAKWPQIESFPVDTTATVDIATASTTSEIIVICGWSLVAAGSVNVKFQSGSTDLDGAVGLVAGAPWTMTCVPGIYATAAGEAAKLNLGSAVQVSGVVLFWRHRA